MYILGLNAYHGDSSACIYKDGILIAATEEERFRRIKHWAGFPSESIKFCLKEAGITIQDLDHIAISKDPKANLDKKLFFMAKKFINFKSVLDRLSNAKKMLGLKEEFEAAFGVPKAAIKAEIHHVEHHRSHLASAFFASNFNEAALFSIDGFGDFKSAMTGTGKANQMNILEGVYYPHSLGEFYTTFTQFLGFQHYGDEYKIMGLAPYGQATYYEQLKDVVIWKDGAFKINLKYLKDADQRSPMTWTDGIPYIDLLYTDYLVQKFGKPRQKDEPLTQEHKNLAASVQKMCEETIFYMLNDLHKKTGLDNLCLAGGVGQNSVANGKILARTPFKNIYIPPAAHDAGTCIGAALYVYNQVLGNPRLPEMQHGYLGYQATDLEIENCLKQKNITYTKFGEKPEDQQQLFDKVTACLLDSGVVGWYQGRAEFGPRALGHRSIIADPRRNDAKDILNAKIKRRESFRPFAPSILKEFVPEYFETVDNVPFMEKVFVIKPQKRAAIPAVTHADGTGRLQTVDKNIEPKYYGLIESFYKKSGVPILLNTSFNENEPIVNLPDEALDCFLRTKMDMLVLGNYLIERQ
jgi:carbamoyltransferase